MNSEISWSVGSGTECRTRLYEGGPGWRASSVSGRCSKNTTSNRTSGSNGSRSFSMNISMTIIATAEKQCERQARTEEGSMVSLIPRRAPTILFGNELATDQPVRVLRDILNTHLRILGPPGMGKTRLLLWLFLTLCKDPDATVILFNFKGDLADMATKGVIAHGLTKRLVTF